GATMHSAATPGGPSSGPRPVETLARGQDRLLEGERDQAADAALAHLVARDDLGVGAAAEGDHQELDAALADVLARAEGAAPAVLRLRRAGLLTLADGQRAA